MASISKATNGQNVSSTPMSNHGSTRSEREIDVKANRPFRLAE
jgi:hypothetical protein